LGAILGRSTAMSQVVRIPDGGVLIASIRLGPDKASSNEKRHRIALLVGCPRVCGVLPNAAAAALGSDSYQRVVPYYLTTAPPGCEVVVFLDGFMSSIARFTLSLCGLYCLLNKEGFACAHSFVR